MNVVMVGPFGLRPRGTMGVRALPMARALTDRGHTVTVLMPPWQNPDDSGRCWEDGGVAVENISLPPSVPGLFHLLTAFRLVIRTLALRPDVVVLFKPKAYSGLTHWMLSLLPRGRRPRLVVDTDDWEGPGGWNDLAPYTPAQRRLFAWQERWGLTHADAVIVASRTLESLVWALGAPPAQVFYVPNGVGYRKLDAKSTGLRNGEQQGPDIQHPVILLYTRFFEFPVTRVIDVFNYVRGHIPDVRLLVVGSGLAGEEEDLFRLAAQSGLTVGHDCAEAAARFVHDIVYCGLVPAEALPDYFARADVAIYPFDDTLVNRAKCAVKLRDLLAAGVPVVAEAVGQNREMICHTETGWLVEPGDVPRFGDAVVRLLGDEGLRLRLAEAATRDMRERFGWERLVGIVEQALGDEGDQGA
jgi:glycosyltransferase involved in cell wall biosynthesis